MKKDFVSRGPSVSDLKAHLVLTTKYRRKVLTASMIDRLHEIFESLLNKWDCFHSGIQLRKRSHPLTFSISSRYTSESVLLTR